MLHSRSRFSPFPRTRACRPSPSRRCPYCQKVWLLLEEKRIPYRIEKINMRCYGDKPPSFTTKVPSGRLGMSAACSSAALHSSHLLSLSSGLLPVLELDGQVITESDKIMRLLEQLYPSRPMLPPEARRAAGSNGRGCQLTNALLSCRGVRRGLGRSSCCGWSGRHSVPGSTGSAAVGRAACPRASESEPCSPCLPLFPDAPSLCSFERVLGVVDKELGSTPGPFFLGADISMVDIAFVPFLERMVASMLYYKGFRWGLFATSPRRAAPS